MKNLSPLATALAAVTILVPMAALSSDSWSPSGEDLVWTEALQVERVDDCRSLTIEGRPLVTHPSGGEIDILCDTVVFGENSVLLTGSDLSIRARVVKGNPRIVSPTKPAAPAPSAPVTRERYRRIFGNLRIPVPNYATQGEPGVHGGNGRDAGMKVRFPDRWERWSSTPGGHGGPGGAGGKGPDGAHGYGRGPGRDGRNITLEFVTLEQARELLVESNGGDGGHGGPGEAGKPGGRGGNGGNGGNGGSANHGMSASRGGNGGNGGRGGNGGNGGDGGAAGDGGNGGNIQIVCNGDLSQLEGVAFHLAAEGGLPGKPGAGGAAGAAGAGGAAGSCGRGGDGSWFNSDGRGCAMGGVHGSPGAAGMPGATGAAGREGKPGLKSYPKVFVRVNGDLEPFPYE